MKLDLDKLEIRARQDSDHNTMSEIDPDTTLALIARIRELEAQGRRTVDAADLAVEDELNTLAGLIERGAVLP